MKIKLQCAMCKKEIEQDEYRVKHNRAWGQKNFFCNSHCSRRYNNPVPGFVLEKELIK